MKKELLIIFLLTLLVIPIAQATLYQTNLNLKSEPDYNFVVRIQGPNGGESIDSIYGKANSSGDISIPFNTTLSKLMFTIIIRYNGETVRINETSAYNTDKDIFIDLRDTIPVEIIETPVVIETNTTNSSENNQTDLTNSDTEVDTETNTEENKSKLTDKLSGLAIFEGSSKYIKSAIYVIIAIFALVIIIFTLRKFKSNFSSNNNEDYEIPLSRLENAEKKLAIANKEFAEIRKKAIEKEEKKLLEEQKKLSRLKGIKEEETMYKSEQKEDEKK